jgi:excisionase family DNA binding protein
MINQLHTQKPQTNRLLKPQDAADMIGVKKSTIWQWCRSGRLPHIRVTPRCFRIRQSDLETYLAGQTR